MLETLDYTIRIGSIPTFFYISTCNRLLESMASTKYIKIVLVRYLLRQIHGRLQ